MEGFKVVRRFDNLDEFDKGEVRDALNELIAPDGYEVVVGLGFKVNIGYYTDFDGLDDGWEEVSLAGTPICAEVGYAPKGWLENLPDFDGF